MANGVRTPRSRGAISGLFLVLLGAWGGIAPFAGPEFGFGYGPAGAWTQTTGRLYLSAVPGAVVVLTGFVVLITRSRWFGGLCAFVAALGGAWFIAGAPLVLLLPASLRPAGLSAGTPIAATAARAALTGIGDYTGVGAAIVFFAALALGRLSITAFRDAQESEVIGYPGQDATSVTGAAAATAQIPAAPGPYVPGLSGYQSSYPSQYPDDPQTRTAQTYPPDDRFPAAADPYQQTQPYPPGQGQQA